MTYTIKAHATKYRGITFRSRLEATWAAFFDLAGWQWSYEPLNLEIETQSGKQWWTPDFIVTFACRHSECRWDEPYGEHTLYCEVKPYHSLEQFKGHIVDKLLWEPVGAKLGLNPSVTAFEMSHGAGGGVFSVPSFVHDWFDLWAKASSFTQYRRVGGTA